MTIKMVATDWLVQKSHRWQIFAAIAAFIILLFVSNMFGVFFTFFGSYLALTLSMTPFIIEDKGKLEHLYLSLPLSRKSIVRGRFAIMLIYVFGTMILTAGLTVLVSDVLDLGYIHYDINPAIVILCCAVGFVFSGIANVVMYPIVFRMGYSKGKVIGSATHIALVIILFLYSAYFINDSERFTALFRFFTEDLGAALTIVTLISLGFGALLYFVSYCLSQRFYARRSL
jgi:hypothetical protein